MAIALVFPGQGSQYVGMGRDLYDNHESLRPLFNSADEISGLEITKTMFEGPEDNLKQTQITQPALYTHSMAVHQLITDKIETEVFAGHSLGEFSALAAAGVFSIEDGMKLVSKRGALMSQAKKGTMAAIIGLGDKDVIEICEGADEVWPANFNSPGQIVISGSPEGIDSACRKAKEAGAKRALPLAVSGAFHTPFMEEAASRFREFLDEFEFNTPRGKVIPNASGKPTQYPDEIKDLLAKQLTSPVRWTETMEAMTNLGVTDVYEIGPGKVLCGLAKRGMSDVNTFPVGSVDQIETAF